MGGGIAIRFNNHLTIGTDDAPYCQQIQCFTCTYSPSGVWPTFSSGVWSYASTTCPSLVANFQSFFLCEFGDIFTCKAFSYTVAASTPCCHLLASASSSACCPTHYSSKTPTAHTQQLQFKRCALVGVISVPGAVMLPLRVHIELLPLVLVTISYLSCGGHQWTMWCRV